MFNSAADAQLNWAWKQVLIVGIFIFLTKWNFMLSWVEHEKSFITSGPDFGSWWTLGRLIAKSFGNYNSTAYITCHYTCSQTPRKMVFVLGLDWLAARVVIHWRLLIETIHYKTGSDITRFKGEHKMFCVQTKVYRLYRKMTIYGHFFYIIYSRLLHYLYTFLFSIQATVLLKGCCVFLM